MILEDIANKVECLAEERYEKDYRDLIELVEGNKIGERLEVDLEDTNIEDIKESIIEEYKEEELSRILRGLDERDYGNYQSVAILLSKVGLDDDEVEEKLGKLRTVVGSTKEKATKIEEEINLLVVESKGRLKEWQEKLEKEKKERKDLEEKQKREGTFNPYSGEDFDEDNPFKTEESIEDLFKDFDLGNDEYEDKTIEEIALGVLNIINKVEDDFESKIEEELDKEELDKEIEEAIDLEVEEGLDKE